MPGLLLHLPQHLLHHAVSRCLGSHQILPFDEQQISYQRGHSRAATTWSSLLPRAGRHEQEGLLQDSRDVWRRYDDELALGLDLAFWCELQLEESLLLPPGIPCRLNGGGVVRGIIRVVEELEPLFLSCRGVFDERRQDLRLGLFLLPILLPFGLVRTGGSRLGPGGFLLLKLGQLLRFFRSRSSSLSVFTLPEAVVPETWPETRVLFASLVELG